MVVLRVDRIVGCKERGCMDMFVLVVVFIIIVGSVVLLLVVLIFLRFASVVMYIPTTGSFSVVFVHVTSDLIDGKTRVFTEVTTDLVLDVIVKALDKTVDTFGLSVQTSASGCSSEDHILDLDG